ncbi:hypothetical protein GW12_06280 [Acinetobacter sp. HR7]|nr:hypothetical protein GW12_06280 [Acinetobacter sp. HR7]
MINCCSGTIYQQLFCLNTFNSIFFKNLRYQYVEENKQDT